VNAAQSKEERTLQCSGWEMSSKLMRFPGNIETNIKGDKCEDILNIRVLLPESLLVPNVTKLYVLAVIISTWKLGSIFYITLLINLLQIKHFNLGMYEYIDRPNASQVVKGRSRVLN
jgi:hypothetical protein